MKRLLLPLAILLLSNLVIFAQDLPENPESGKCYVRCKTIDIFDNIEETIIVKPAFKKLISHPAEYKTVTEEVLIKEESEKWIVHQAEWGTKENVYLKKEKGSTIETTLASFKDNYVSLEIKPASAGWTLGVKMPDCDSPDPNDCRIWCYQEIPAVYEKYSIQELDNDAERIINPIPEENSNYSSQVVIKEPYIEKIIVPAEYATITKTVLVKDAWVEEINVPEETIVVTKEVLVKKGGLTVWREIDCKLTEYSLLPINWLFGSYELTNSAKEIIDEKLIVILEANPEVVLEIASHTDSRGTKDSNHLLSERRAQAVVNYLVEKNINPSRLVPVGYGETKLLNRCADGVICTEREHLQNRRTEFRIISEIN